MVQWCDEIFLHTTITCTLWGRFHSLLRCSSKSRCCHSSALLKLVMFGFLLIFGFSQFRLHLAEGVDRVSR
ncbi:hypothetical protein L195_g049016, partial [Trifolium pratense]